jgi:hypothetical protein
METLAFASQLMTILYNEVSPSYTLLIPSPVHLFSPLLQSSKNTTWRKTNKKEE